MHEHSHMRRQMRMYALCVPGIFHLIFSDFSWSELKLWEVEQCTGIPDYILMSYIYFSVAKGCVGWGEREREIQILELEVPLRRA